MHELILELILELWQILSKILSSALLFRCTEVTATLIFVWIFAKCTHFHSIWMMKIIVVIQVILDEQFGVVCINSEDKSWYTLCWLWSIEILSVLAGRIRNLKHSLLEFFWSNILMTFKFWYWSSSDTYVAIFIDLIYFFGHVLTIKYLFRILINHIAIEKIKLIVS